MNLSYGFRVMSVSHAPNFSKQLGDEPPFRALGRLYALKDVSELFLRIAYRKMHPMHPDATLSGKEFNLEENKAFPFLTKIAMWTLKNALRAHVWTVLCMFSHDNHRLRISYPCSNRLHIAIGIYQTCWIQSCS